MTLLISTSAIGQEIDVNALRPHVDALASSPDWPTLRGFVEPPTSETELMLTTMAMGAYKG